MKKKIKRKIVLTSVKFHVNLQAIFSKLGTHTAKRKFIIQQAKINNFILLMN